MKRKLTGTVVSDAMEKTRVVEVTRDVLHPIYKKRYRVSKRFYAHDEKEQAREGDVVTMEETRPLSKLKRWRIVGIVGQSAVRAGQETKEKAETETAHASTAKSSRRSRRLRKEKR
jgi:small subunit ribosomal protein S17